MFCLFNKSVFIIIYFTCCFITTSVLAVEWVQLGGDIDGEAPGDLSGITVSLSADGTRVAIGAVDNDDGGSNAGQVRVYDYDSSTWIQVGGDVDGEAAGDKSGWATSLSDDGTRLAIGAYLNDGIGTNSGHTRIYEYDSSAWVQLGGDIDAESVGDQSGRAVFMSGDGTRVVIGAIGSDDAGSNAGHARVYEYNSTDWVQVGGDMDGEAAGDLYGIAVSLSKDGTRVAIGGYKNSDGGSLAGHVRVFEYDSSTWVQLGVDINGEDANDQSGVSVSLSSDGSRVAIGAKNNGGGGAYSGHVRVFEYNSSAWHQLGNDIDGEAASDQSGFDGSVSISSNGTRVAIGAYLNDGGAANAGHVRVYDFNTLTTSWDLVGQDIDGDEIGGGSGRSVSLSSAGVIVAVGAYLVNASTGQVRVWQLVDSPTGLPSAQPTGQPTYGIRDWIQVGGDIDGEASGDWSGYSVSLSSDGSRLAVGAFFNDAGGSNSGHVRIYEYDSSTWNQVGADIDGEAADDNSGLSVSLSLNGTVVAIGARGNDGGGSGAGHVRVYEYDSSTWIQVGADIEGESAGDQSGYSVSLSSDGSRLAVGAPYNDDGDTDAGQVRVYEYDTSTWVQVGVDIDGEASNDRSGIFVSMSSEGTVVAIGAHRHDGVGSDSGYVRVYEYDSSTWVQLGGNIEGEAAGDFSGVAVSLCGGGTRVAIGAKANDGGGTDSGHVRVFEYNSSAWIQLGNDIDGEAAGDYSGFDGSVSLSNSGSRVAIGSYLNDDGGTNAGHVRVFDYDLLASSWALVGEKIIGDVVNGYSGQAVSLSSDGNKVAIGAYGVNSAVGQVRVWQLAYVPTGEPSAQPTGQPTYGLREWIQVGEDIDGEASGDWSGYSVSLSSDGSRLAVGAFFNDAGGSNSGHVRIYEYDSSTWNQVGADIDGEAADDNSGLSVSLSLNGTVVAIGARGNDGGGSGAGHVRVYEYDSSTWIQVGADIEGESAGDQSGYSVSLSSDGSRLAVGAPYNDDGDTDAGQVRVYEYDTSTWVQVGVDIDGEASNDRSGIFVSMSSEGTVVAIGAHRHDGVGSDSGYVRVYEYDSSTWVQLGGNIEGEAAGDFSGVAVSLCGGGTRVAIGAKANDGGGTDSGHVRVFEYNSSAWIQLGNDIDGEAAGDYSGFDGSVSLSNSGSRVAIGSYLNDDGGTNAGHVRVFDYDLLASSWALVGEKIIGDVVNGYSGQAVSLSSDGNKVAIGAYGVNSAVGQVRVWQLAYVPTGEPSAQPTGQPTYGLREWIQVGEDIDGEASGDWSGYSVSLSSDGSRLAVGAFFNDAGGSNSGHVRIYEYDSSTWNQVGADIDGEAADDNSGLSVSLSLNGTVVAIGARGNDGGGSGAGHVRVYEYDSSTWIQVGADIEGESAGDQSGYSVSLSSDGSRLAVGAPYNDDGDTDAGQVRVYEYDTSTWVQVGVDIDGEASNDRSGIFVSMSSEGTVVAIGAHRHDGVGSDSGYVRVYEYDSSTWVQLGGNIEGEAAGDFSGVAVSLCGGGTRVAIGAKANDGGGTDSGHVRVFEYNSSAWIQLGNDIDGEAAGDYSGFDGSVSLSNSGSRVAIGSYLNDDGGTNAGHVRVFDYDLLASSWALVGEKIIGDVVNGYSGQAVSLSSDGNKVAIGAYGVNSAVGQVRVWQLAYVPTGEPSAQPTGQPTYGLREWIQVGEDINGEAIGDYSGIFVSLSGDGSRVAIGADLNDGGGLGAGHVRVYEYSTSTWVQLGADIDGEAEYDFSGLYLSLSGDGSRVAIGARSNDGGGDLSGHVRIYDYDSTNWVQVGGDIDGETAGDQSGRSVFLSSDGTRVAIGSMLNDDGAADAGHVRVFEYNSSTWVQIGGDIDGEAAYDQSGISVSLSSDGGRIAVGAFRNDGGGANAGHVRVYDYDSAAWVQAGGDIDGEAIDDQSGTAVSLSSDGTRVAIGAKFNDDGGSNAGHVRVFEYISTAWVQLGGDIDGEAADDQSGFDASVSLSGDGTRVAVGAYLNDGGGSNAGHVRVYDYDFLSTSWCQIGVDIDGDAVDGNSGRSVSLSSDGSRVAIGATGVNSNAGQVRIWQLAYSPTGQPTGQPTFGVRNWFQIGSDLDGEAEEDWSGWSVSLSSDGDRVAIGASLNDGAGSGSGHVRVYEYVTSAWVQLGQDIDGEATGDQSGYSVSLTADGNRVAIGAFANDGTATNAGQVRVYDFDSSSWVQVGGDIDGEALLDYLGCSVSLSANGTRLAAGGYLNDGTGTDAGHVRVYEYDSSTWIQLGSDIDGEAAGDFFGWSVSLSADGSRVAVGAYYNDGGGANAGHSRVFEYDSTTWNQLGSDIDGSTGDFLGHSVSLSNDGKCVAVGAYGGSYAAIYEFINSAWVRKGSDIVGENPGDYAGWSVSLSSDGTRVAVGGPRNDGGGTDAGHVRIFDYDFLASQWIQIGIDIDGDEAQGWSGDAVSLSSDGSRVAIGARKVGNERGQVRIWQLAYVPTGEPSGEPSAQPTGQPTYGIMEWIQVGGNIDGEASGDESGRIVSLSRDGNIVAIAARFDDDGGDDAGHVRVYEYDASTWIQLGGDIDGETAGDQSGVYISLSGNGTRVAVGALSNDDGGTSAGHVRVYEYDLSNWVQLGGDMDGEAAADWSGFSVALTSDGTRVAIGARYNDDGGSNAGHVRVFDYNSSAWVQLGGDIDGAATDDNCGYAVSLSSDVARVATGCTGRGSGRVQILEYDTSTWVQVGEDIDGAAVGDLGGASVSLSSDGTRVAIGSPNNDDGGTDAGHVRIFEYDSSSWVQLGGDIVGEAAGDLSSWYGSLSLSSDGSRVAVGAYLNDGFGADAGHVRVFDYDVLASSWSQLGGDIDGDAVDGFSGRGVSLSSDGSRVAIGANGVNGLAGQVRIWQLAYVPTGEPSSEPSGSPSCLPTSEPSVQPTGQPTYGIREWIQVGGNIDGEASGDHSGRIVSLSRDGNVVAIAARYNDDGGDNAGHVRVYEYDASTWMQLGGDIDGENAGDQSGVYISLSGNGTRVAVGALSNDDGGTSAGHVRVYEYDLSNWVQLGGDMDGEAAADWSGFSVALTSDGTRVAIGARYNDGGGTKAGHVRVFDYNSTAWVQLGSDIDGAATDDNCGYAVSLSSDVARVATGCTGRGSGRVEILEYDTSTWVQVGRGY